MKERFFDITRRGFLLNSKVVFDELPRTFEEILSNDFNFKFHEITS